MRHFSSPRVEGLEFTMYEDGSGGAEYKGKSIGSIDLQTKEIKIEGDGWRAYPYDSNLEAVFIEQAENYVLKNKNTLKEMVASGQLDKAAAAELLLTTDMISIAELSPYFDEDPKASIKLNETTAEFLINKSPELKSAFEEKGYDNWRTFFENNNATAYIEKNDISDIGITVVLENSSKEYPIPLSAAEKDILREQLDEEVKRRNKEDLEDKDGDHIPDRIDGTYSPDGFRTQTDIDYNKYSDEDYRKALVTADEYKELKAKGFECQKAKKIHEDGRIPIRFKAADKEKYKEIIKSLGGKNGGIHL